MTTSKGNFMDFDRKTRDRKGGHYASSGYTPANNAIMKREGKKALRRQHKKAYEKSLRDYYDQQEVWDHWSNLLDLYSFEPHEEWSHQDDYDDTLDFDYMGENLYEDYVEFVCRSNSTAKP